MARTAEAGWPRRVYGVGEAPDPRFTLANERTFLAWMRTALALLLAGVVVDLVAPGGSTPVRVAAALSLVLASVCCAVGGWRGWLRAELALRQKEALPSRAVEGALVLVLLSTAVCLLVIGMLLGS